MQLNGARILIECLIREGVNIIFGYPGGSVLDIYDELPQYGEQLRHVLVRHEQAAVHAADGYARATGKVGVCMATSGPGATNTVTGIATAYCDSIPMVIFTGQVPTGLIGNDAFQEVDIAGITRPCTKHNYVVKDVKDLAKVVRQAFYLARSGRPGPVLVDLPKNVLQGSAEFVWPEDVSLRSYNPTYRPNYAQIRKVVDALYNAERPLLFGGGGVIMSNASEEFRNLAKNLSIPVTCSLMGLGAFPCDHPQRHGGVTGQPHAVSDPADLHAGPGQKAQKRVIAGRVAARNFNLTARARQCGGVGRGGDAVRQRAVKGSAQRSAALHGQHRRARALNIRPAGRQKHNHVADLRLLRSAAQHGLPRGAAGGHQQGHCGPDAGQPQCKIHPMQRKSEAKRS